MEETEQSVMCPKHPWSAAQYVCGECGSPACDKCCYGLPDGTVSCITCYQKANEVVAAPVVTPGLYIRQKEPSAAAEEKPRVTVPAAGKGCVQHPKVFPVARCQSCSANVCATCDFEFPPDRHFCPLCMSTLGGKLSPRRKGYMITAFILAGISSLGALGLFIAVVLLGEHKGDAVELIAGLASLVSMLFAIFGLAFAMSALLKGSNPIPVWIAFIWNMLLLGGYLLLILAGVFIKD